MDLNVFSFDNHNKDSNLFFNTENTYIINNNSSNSYNCSFKIKNQNYNESNDERKSLFSLKNNSLLQIFQNKEKINEKIENNLKFQVNHHTLNGFKNTQKLFTILGKRERNNENSLLIKMKVGKDNVFKCPICSKQFTKISAVYRHNDNSHKFPNGRPCSNCGKNIKNLYYHRKKCLKKMNTNEINLKRNIISSFYFQKEHIKKSNINIEEYFENTIRIKNKKTSIGNFIY